MTHHYTALAIVPVSPTANRQAAWQAALEPYSPEVNRTDRGLSELVIEFPARDLAQAVRTGSSALFAAAGIIESGSFRVLTTVDYEAERAIVDLAPLPSLVSIAEAASIIGVARQRAQQLVELGHLRAVKAGSTWAVARYDAEQLAAARAAGKTVDG